MVLRLRDTLGAFEAEPREVAAQLGQRPFMQEAGQVVGGEGQQFAAPEADEQVVELALGGDRVAGDRGRGQHTIGLAQRSRATTQRAECAQQPRIGRGHEKPPEQREQPRALDRHCIRTYVQYVRRRHALAALPACSHARIGANPDCLNQLESL